MQQLCDDEDNGPWLGFERAFYRALLSTALVGDAAVAVSSLDRQP